MSRALRSFQRALPGFLALWAATAVRPASAVTIIPTFDSSITGSANAAAIEGAINAAIGTIDSLYSNAGTIGILFDASSTPSFLGQSQTADLAINYSGYAALLGNASAQQPTNTVLASAVQYLGSGNVPGPGGNVFVTSADARLALGLTGVTGCFDSGGNFNGACGQSYFGVVTLSTYYPLTYTTTPVSGAYSATSVMEHEIDEILGGGGQGSLLNAIIDGNTSLSQDRGVLDFYRYAAPGVPCFSDTCSSAYLSVNGGTTSIVAFNQNASDDLGDFGPSGYVQSAGATPGNVPAYTTASPEVAMMESIGYDGTVPEPASATLLAPALLALMRLRRRPA